MAMTLPAHTMMKRKKTEMKKITEKTKVSLTLKQLRKLVKESRMWRGTIKLKNIRWASDDPKLPKEAEIYVEYPLLDDWEDAECEEWGAIEDAMREEYGTEPSDADIDERDDGVDWDDWDAFEDDEEEDEDEDEDEDEEPAEEGPCTYKVKLDRTGGDDFDGLPDFTIDASSDEEAFSKIVKKLQDRYFVRGHVMSVILDVLKNGKSVMDELDNWYTCEKLVGRITETFESKSMKKINENTKVTLTFAQIKKLVKEARFSDKLKDLDAMGSNNLEGQMLKDLQAIETNEDLKEAAQLLNKMSDIVSKRKLKVPDNWYSAKWVSYMSAGFNMKKGPLYGWGYVCSTTNKRYDIGCSMAENENGSPWGVDGLEDGHLWDATADGVVQVAMKELKPKEQEDFAKTIHKMVEDIPAVLDKVEAIYNEFVKVAGVKVSEGRFADKLQQLEMLGEEESSTDPDYPYAAKDHFDKTFAVAQLFKVNDLADKYDRVYLFKIGDYVTAFGANSLEDLKLVSAKSGFMDSEPPYSEIFDKVWALDVNGVMDSDSVNIGAPWSEDWAWFRVK